MRGAKVNRTGHDIKRIFSNSNDCAISAPANKKSTPSVELKRKECVGRFIKKTERINTKMTRTQPGTFNSQQTFIQARTFGRSPVSHPGEDEGGKG